MSDVKQLAQQIRALRDMGGIALRARYVEVTGRRTATRNNTWIRQHIAIALAERLDANHPVLKRAVRTATTPRKVPAKPTPHDPRVPPAGTVIRRPYRGRVLEVRVAKDGFRFDGRHFPSLSSIARHVTGARWSGPLFFGLASRSRTKGATK